MISIFDNNEVNLIIIVALLYVIVIVYFNLVNKTKRIISDKKKGEFFKVLINGLENNTISTLEDVLNLHDGVSGNMSTKINNHIILQLRLKELSVILVSENKNYLDGIDKSKILEWKQKIDNFIKKNDEQSPYSELPIIEKNILNDIMGFIENKDVESVKRKILELSNTIKIRNDDLKRVQNGKNISTAFAVIGTVMTIFFGVWALSG